MERVGLHCAFRAGSARSLHHENLRRIQGYCVNERFGRLIESLRVCDEFQCFRKSHVKTEHILFYSKRAMKIVQK